MLPNRKRSIHQYIRQVYRQENVKIFRKLERTEKKMVDFKNHRRFLLRCLENKIIPVSLKLRSNLKTPKAIKIIRKTERSLLNERIRSINNTIEMLKHEKDTCIEILSKVLTQEDMDECHRFMFRTKEERHYKTMAWQKSKLERLARKNEEKTGGHINRYMYMYEQSQSGTDNSSLTSTTTDARPDLRSTTDTGPDSSSTVSTSAT